MVKKTVTVEELENPIIQFTTVEELRSQLKRVYLPSVELAGKHVSLKLNKTGLDGSVLVTVGSIGLDWMELNAAIVVLATLAERNSARDSEWVIKVGAVTVLKSSPELIQGVWECSQNVRILERFA